MKAIKTAHDRYFRASMQHATVARQFFQQNLPKALLAALDIQSLKLEKNSYIDKSLRESISDLVFNCSYKHHVKSESAKIAILVEHQSTPDKFMPFRVFHYMFNMLHNILLNRAKKTAKDKLPAVYALVFYHGEQNPYPYSMDLLQCFDDPLEIMKGVFSKEVPLIDVRDIHQDKDKQEHIIDVVTGAIKHSRDKNIDDYFIPLFNLKDPLDLTDPMTLELITMTINYLLNVANIKNTAQLIENSQLLPQPVRGEIMTAAEQLKAIGRQEGIVAGRQEGLEQGEHKKAIETARKLKALKTMNDQQIAELTELPLSEVEQLAP